MAKRLLTALSFVQLLFCRTNTSAQIAEQTKHIENLTSEDVDKAHRVDVTNQLK